MSAAGIPVTRYKDASGEATRDDARPMGASVPIINALTKEAAVHAPTVDARGPIRIEGANDRLNPDKSSVTVASPTRAAYERRKAGLETPAGSIRH